MGLNVEVPDFATDDTRSPGDFSMGSTGSMPIFQVLNTVDGYVRRQISNEERFTDVRKRVAKRDLASSRRILQIQQRQIDNQLQERYDILDGSKRKDTSESYSKATEFHASINLTRQRQDQEIELKRQQMASKEQKALGRITELEKIRAAQFEQKMQKKEESRKAVEERMKSGEKALYQVQDEYVAVLEQRVQRAKRNQGVHQASLKCVGHGEEIKHKLEAWKSSRQIETKAQVAKMLSNVRQTDERLQQKDQEKSDQRQLVRSSRTDHRRGVLSHHEKLSAMESEAREAKALKWAGKQQQVEALQAQQHTQAATRREARDEYRLRVLLQRDDNRRQDEVERGELAARVAEEDKLFTVRESRKQLTLHSVMNVKLEVQRQLQSLNVRHTILYAKTVDEVERGVRKVDSFVPVIGVTRLPPQRQVDMSPTSPVRRSIGEHQRLYGTLWDVTCDPRPASALGRSSGGWMKTPSSSPRPSPCPSSRISSTRAPRLPRRNPMFAVTPKTPTHTKPHHAHQEASLEAHLQDYVPVSTTGWAGSQNSEDSGEAHEAKAGLNFSDLVGVVTEITEQKELKAEEGTFLDDSAPLLDESAQPPASKALATPGRSREALLQSAEALEGYMDADERAEWLRNVQREELEAKALYNRTRCEKAMMNESVSYMHASPFLLAAMNNPLDDIHLLEDSDQEEGNTRPSARQPRGKSKSKVKKGNSKKKLVSRKEV